MSNNDSSPDLPSEGIRINKYLAACGYESRRKADQLIADGLVEINGKRVEAPGARVMPGDYVKVSGHRALPKEEATLLLNKPRGFVCSRDAQGAEGTVYDLLPPKYRYVNYIGRLDADSEGLLILTNKNELNQKLSHPSNGVEKEYWVTLNQPFENSVLLQLLKGVRIPEGQAKAKYISRLSARRACVVLEQGLKRQIRQMFACLGFRVRKLVRVRIGSLWGGDLMPGRAMLLTPEQEQLAATNPPQRKGMISAAQAFPKSGSALSREQMERALDEKTARAALEEETDYVFNPADFETEEEAEAPVVRSWDDAEDTPRHSRGFFRVPRGEDGRLQRRPGKPRREEDDDFAPRKRTFGGQRRGFDRRDSDERPRRFHREEGDDFAPRKRTFGGQRRSFDRRDSDERPRRSGFGKPGTRRFGKPTSRSGSSFAPRRSAPKRGGKRF